MLRVNRLCNLLNQSRMRKRPKCNLCCNPGNTKVAHLNKFKQIVSPPAYIIYSPIITALTSYFFLLSKPHKFPANDTYLTFAE